MIDRTNTRPKCQKPGKILARIRHNSYFSAAPIVAIIMRMRVDTFVLAPFSICVARHYRFPR
jgi:hypothetical protein